MDNEIKTNEKNCSIKFIGRAENESGIKTSVLIAGTVAEPGKTYTVGDLDAADLVARGLAVYGGADK